MIDFRGVDDLFSIVDWDVGLAGKRLVRLVVACFRGGDLRLVDDRWSLTAFEAVI